MINQPPEFRKTMLAASVALMMSMVLIGGCSTSNSALIQPASGTQYETGQRVYNQNCASCHGLNGEGQYPQNPMQPDANGLIGAPPHNATGHTWHHADQLLIQTIKAGSTAPGFHPMPAFGDKLSDDDIRAVLAYIKTWWGPEELSAQATVTARYTPRLTVPR